MVDRNRRAQMAEALRHFASGRTTNFDFEDELWEVLRARKASWKEDDGALWAIQSRSWFLYDDVRRHRLDGKWKLTRQGRREIARWIIFLHSDLEYQWPIQNFVSLGSCPLTIVTLGLANVFLFPILRKRIESKDDWIAWPFLHISDFDAQKLRPRLLTGTDHRASAGG